MSIYNRIYTFTVHKYIIFLLLFVFGGIFFIMAIANHYYFRTTTFDYGYYNFVLWDFSHFHYNTVPSFKVYGTDFKFLQDHFTLMMFYLVPIYWIIGWITGSYTILLIMVALIIWSAWAIYRLIQLKTGDGWLGVFAVLLYFLLQGRYSAFQTDANILTLASCCIPLFIYYFESKKYIVSGIIFVLALSSREDIPLWFIFIVLIIWHWKDRKIVRYCFYFMSTSILYFVLLFIVLIPAFHSPENQHTIFLYSALGENSFEAVKFIFNHPVKTFELLFVNQSNNHSFDDVKEEFYLVYFISGGFILFFRSRYFIWFIPLIAEKMFNDNPVRWGITGYYSVPIVTMLPISIFIIVSKLRWKSLKYIISFVLCLLAFY